MGKSLVSGSGFQLRFSDLLLAHGSGGSSVVRALSSWHTGAEVDQWLERWALGTQEQG